MKKLLTVLGVVLVATGLSFAAGNYANGGFGNPGTGMHYWQNQNMPNNTMPQNNFRGKRGQWGYQCFYGQNNVANLTKEDAKSAVLNVVNGEITSVKEFKVPRGVVYDITVQAEDGKTLNYRVNPWGNVIGPFIFN